MIDVTLRIEAFVKLGTFFKEFCISANKEQEKQTHSSDLYNTLEDRISLAKHKNGWFNRENILYSLENWANTLSEENIQEWVKNYDLKSNIQQKTVALIMAGNIPLVGFHDFLCVLITGHKAVIKLSSNDNILLPIVTDILTDIEPKFKDYIVFEEGKLANFDLVIATGSNNTARYFEHYFSKKPHIIRKNRNSVAVITGNELKEELTALGKDIFTYYGLGCRSVSKVFVPSGYDFDTLFKALYEYHPIIEQIKYSNNYDYNKAVYLMSNFKLLDNGFLILKEDSSYSSPIASLFYENYATLDEIKTKLNTEEEKIQCIVAKGVVENEINFGETQKPSLSNYADNVDTIAFLLKNS